MLKKGFTKITASVIAVSIIAFILVCTFKHFSHKSGANTIKKDTPKIRKEKSIGNCDKKADALTPARSAEKHGILIEQEDYV